MNTRRNGAGFAPLTAAAHKLRVCDSENIHPIFGCLLECQQCYVFSTHDLINNRLKKGLESPNRNFVGWGGKRDQREERQQTRAEQSRRQRAGGARARARSPHMPM